jgi:hypothetical protein
VFSFENCEGTTAKCNETKQKWESRCGQD